MLANVKDFDFHLYGAETSITESAKIMAELEGYGPEINGLVEKVEGSFAVYADNSLLKSLGWTPAYSVRDGFGKVLARVDAAQSGRMTLALPAKTTVCIVEASGPGLKPVRSLVVRG